MRGEGSLTQVSAILETQIAVWGIQALCHLPTHKTCVRAQAAHISVFLQQGSTCSTCSIVYSKLSLAISLIKVKQSGQVWRVVTCKSQKTEKTPLTEERVQSKTNHQIKRTKLIYCLPRGGIFSHSMYVNILDNLRSCNPRLTYRPRPSFLHALNIWTELRSAFQFNICTR